MSTAFFNTMASESKRQKESHPPEVEVLIVRLAHFYERAHTSVEAIRPVETEALKAVYDEVVREEWYQTVRSVPRTLEERAEFFARCDAMLEWQPGTPEQHWKVILACMAAIRAMLAPDSELSKHPDAGYIMGVAHARSYEKIIKRIPMQAPSSSAFFPTPDMPLHFRTSLSPMVSYSYPPNTVDDSTLPGTDDVTVFEPFRCFNADTKREEEITVVDFGTSYMVGGLYYEISTAWEGHPDDGQVYKISGKEMRVLWAARLPDGDDEW
ncbi:hypothetical protein BJ138DRAFT_1167368 [Hygrophoropsis aurantiaca]|uniref:Uncharacterized protein n=1 Tax=Hygrophoropsis aurantiaca TaxID=72124 RepID=A0ACB7ZUC9_9AGAM|nr:hypothetical protein BJ138DRAFT_1167368 [Hygrophoropsis aurantiaca]